MTSFALYDTCFSLSVIAVWKRGHDRGYARDLAASDFTVLTLWHPDYKSEIVSLLRVKLPEYGYIVRGGQSRGGSMVELFGFDFGRNIARAETAPNDYSTNQRYTIVPILSGLKIQVVTSALETGLEPACFGPTVQGPISPLGHKVVNNDVLIGEGLVTNFSFSRFCQV